MQAMLMQAVSSLHQRAQQLQADIQGIMAARSSILHTCITVLINVASDISYKLLCYLTAYRW